MVALARARYPQLEFQGFDGRGFTVRDTLSGDAFGTRRLEVRAPREAIVDALLETIGETIYRTFSWLFGRSGTDAGAQWRLALGNVVIPKSVTESRIVENWDALDVTLDAGLAPQAVSSILADTLTGYYVDKTCHRLVATDSAGLIQCGSLNGDGATDPTYSYGPIENAPADGVYPAGTIAMARGGDNAYSNGRQFFIVTQDTVLPGDSVGGYSVVGTVTSGLDSLIARVTAAGTADGSSDGAPLIPTTITSFTIQ